MIWKAISILLSVIIFLVCPYLISVDSDIKLEAEVIMLMVHKHQKFENMKIGDGALVLPVQTHAVDLFYLITVSMSNSHALCCI